MKASTTRSGQSILEFTFSMVAVMLLMYGMVKVFQWVGFELAERRYDHDRLLTNTDLNAKQQLNPDFHRPRPFDTGLFN